MIVAQLSLKARRLIHCRNAAKSLQLRTHPVEELIAPGFGLRGQQCVQQTRLAAAEPHMAIFSSSHPGHSCYPPQPFFRQQSVAAVAQPDHIVAAPRRRQQFRKVHHLISILHIALQFEPVEPAGNFELEIPRRAECLAIGFNVPVTSRQRPHQTG